MQVKYLCMENLFFDKLNSCRLCPRKCGVNRLAGAKGFCQAAGKKVSVARVGLHMWEEPCISGTGGSGTVFFTGCNLGCVYCQNRHISRGQASGILIDVKRLAEIFLELQQQGAHNINLVTPTHYACHIKAALVLAVKKGLHIPVVYNCGGYELPETIEFLRENINIYLTDFKYWDRGLAEKYSAAGNYPARAIRALDAMAESTGKAVFDNNGIMLKGVIVRHMVLPGAVENSLRIIGFLKQRYGDNIYISIMNQYTPPEDCLLPEELRQPVSREDYRKVLAFADDIGLENGFIQEGGTVSESFIPDFNGQGVLTSAIEKQ